MVGSGQLAPSGCVLLFVLNKRHLCWAGRTLHRRWVKPGGLWKALRENIDLPNGLFTVN